MRLAVSAGHNVYIWKYFDPGATRNPYIEADITKETVALLIPMLKAQGHQVIDVTPYNQKFNDSKAHHVLRCQQVDNFQADLFLDIHVNSGGGTGVECWVHNMNSKSVPYAEKICNNISKKIGFANRGVKAKPGYWSVSLTIKAAIIVEGSFIDNKSNMEKLTPKKYAIAIAECFGKVETKEDNKVNNKEHWGEEIYQRLLEKGIKFDEKRFDDKLTRAEAFAIVGKVTDWVERKIEEKERG